MKGALSSATAIAGEGDHPAQQGGGGGAGLNETKASQTCSGVRARSSTTTKRRVTRPLHHGSLASRAPVVPLPRCRRGGKCLRSRGAYAPSIHCKKNKKAKEAERRQTQGVLSEPRERMLPLARASGPARAEAQRARLSAFRRGTCGGERTPPLNSSPRFLGPGVIGCYPHLACPFSPASCLAVPVVVPDGRIRRSRPGAR